MSESKHSPGPWTVDKSINGLIVDVEDNEVADTNSAEQFPHQLEANAKLIAAAPDMLKALQDTLKWYELAKEFLPAVEYRIEQTFPKEMLRDVIRKALEG